MDLNLRGKIVVISGAAGKEGSIGETILQRLGEEGAIPAVIDRNSRGFDYVKKLQQKGVDAVFCQTDVTDPEQIEKALNTISKKYGRIDVVINNVGVNDGVGLDGSYEEFMNSLKLNMVSYFMIVKYALPFLITSKGNILNIGSKVALTGQGRTSGYAASKGGVLGLTREWAVDLIHYGIRSNAIIIAESWTPSYDTWIRTLPNGEEKLKSIIEKIPLENRMTSTDEIANACLFTISDRSSHTTGQFIFVDGGYVHLDRSLLTDE
ncbi:SDR family oxidoreductase [Flagellimonas algicola]|uniref:SDR family oxidoreductase n=1 Tax=Flagellimonas algicola TaxID=2583815 RepID=A0ABY2WRM4_9FLAO|nr:SDR family oxidoreductase [Allomuricauda algicola]TMU57291.1 SDR family oxidoreductase [Allomuricauda algicola]